MVTQNEAPTIAMAQCLCLVQAHCILKNLHQVILLVILDELVLALLLVECEQDLSQVANPDVLNPLPAC